MEKGAKVFRLLSATRSGNYTLKIYEIDLDKNCFAVIVVFVVVVVVVVVVVFVVVLVDCIAVYRPIPYLAPASGDRQFRVYLPLPKNSLVVLRKCRFGAVP